MKNALIPGIALAVLVSAASAGQATIYVPAPAPAPCPEPCPYTMEVGFKYGFANADIFRGPSDNINTYGGDLTLVYNINENHSLNLRGGYTFGDTVHRPFNLRHETDLHTFYLMPGYRYTHIINEKWSAYIGANVGAANLSVKDNLRGPDVHLTAHNSEYGFGYSGEVGLRYRICETRELFLAYEFFGSTANPRVGNIATERQTYNVIRTGMSFKF